MTVVVILDDGSGADLALRDGVHLRAQGQKDPLVEYKTEGFEMFQSMMASIEENVVQTVLRLTDPEERSLKKSLGPSPSL